LPNRSAKYVTPIFLFIIQCSMGFENAEYAADLESAVKVEKNGSPQKI
jgi:hypothetical protein